MPDDKDLRGIAGHLLTKIDYLGSFVIQDLTLGRNNKVVKLKTPKRDYILKLFFENAIDGRDRFGAETRFYDFIATMYIEQSSKCLASSQSNRAILLEFIEGQRLTSPEIDDATFGRMMDFICALNDKRGSGSSLPLASESCFSDRDHVDLLDRRIERLSTEVQDRTAANFVSDQLVPTWHQVRKDAQRTSIEWETPLTLEGRCISPSDFGFHNCLRRSDGSVVFYDFEYAGWDDPAKLVCDLFCQIEVPIPLRHLPVAIERIETSLRINRLADRVAWLMPIIRIKWCCILLNEFITVDAKRRHFSGRPTDDTARNKQLEKTAAVLATARTDASPIQEGIL